MIELYYAAESKNYLVCGTTNRTETVQGFFVKYGDGGVDIEPIAGLYKVQVFQIADHLGVMEEIINRVPTADTYSLEASDEEFYFRIPYDTLDLLLYAWEHKISIPEVCRVMGLEEAQVKRVFRDFVSKFDVTKHLRTLPPSLDPLA
jgi:NAD+ synthase